MRPTFKIKRTECLHVTENYLCNGHWLVNRKVPAISWFRPIKALAAVKHGRYPNGIGGDDSRIDFEEERLNQIVPKPSGYMPITFEKASVDPDEFKINAFIFSFDGGNKKIGVSPDYVELLKFGKAYAKDSLSPVLVTEGDQSDNMVAVVMPLRI